jgi:Fic-DOC domain mobile mystery protein B
MRFVYDEASTPINPDEIRNLIPLHLQTQSELNLWEQNNIVDAENKLFKSKLFKSRKTLNMDEAFIKNTHKLMFNKTWKWAGKFRTTNTNIGIEWLKIPQEIRLLCDDFAFQLANNSFQLDEIAVRFSHRFVCIHPFPNGNGRCSRLITDWILVKNGRERFTWGRKNLVNASETRTKYINALKAEEIDGRPMSIDDYCGPSVAQVQVADRAWRESYYDLRHVCT